MPDGLSNRLIARRALERSRERFELRAQLGPLAAILRLRLYQPVGQALDELLAHAQPRRVALNQLKAAEVGLDGLLYAVRRSHVEKERAVADANGEYGERDSVGEHGEVVERLDVLGAGNDALYVHHNCGEAGRAHGASILWVGE